jgi:Protein of unknown function DUF45
VRHLRTFCEWLVRKFSITHDKRCFVIWVNKPSNTIGKHTKFRGENGLIYHEILLNEWHLKLLAPEHVDGTVMHECAHTLANGHGKKFRNACNRLGLEQEYQGTTQPKAHYQKGVLETVTIPRNKKRVKI